MHLENSIDLVRKVDAKEMLVPLDFKVAGERLETTPVFQAYWHFAAERQRIFFKRVNGSNSPILTDDKILSQYKFTNSYRASDRVSQYLIKNVIYRSDLPSDAENVFYRILLFKIFNKIETWEAIQDAFGPVVLANFNFDEIDEFLSARQYAGLRNYSAAYIMPSVGRVFGHKRKHSNHLKLIMWMLAEKYPSKLSKSNSMKEGFDLFLSTPSIGPFLAYQFITDVNYSEITNFSEMEFVKAGPGALDGISKCFVDTKKLPPEKIISEMTKRQNQYFENLEIDFPSLWGRELQLIDCQNLFCEVSKYSRVSHPEILGKTGRTRIKQKYRPIGRPPAPWYPPSWRLNDSIELSYETPMSTKVVTEKNNQLAFL